MAILRRTIRRTVDYDHPRDRVWHALTDPAALQQWLMPNDFQPKVGHRFTFRTHAAPGFDGIVKCEVKAMEPPESMTWSWVGGPLDTEVRFRLESVSPEKTRLHFEHRGFEGFRAMMVSFILASGFRKMYRLHLPKILDQLADGTFDASAPPAFPAPADVTEKAVAMRAAWD